MKDNKFKRRKYRNLRHFGRDVRFFIRDRDKIRGVMKGELVSHAFRSRLMLAVTAVNGCRYCAYYHAKEAIKAGVPDAEMRNLLHGVAEDAPADELPAILYAQHWAESDGKPEPETRQEISKIYDAERMQAIETTLKMISIGNLLGNQWDYFLYRLSFGRYGLLDAEHELLAT